MTRHTFRLGTLLMLCYCHPGYTQTPVQLPASATEAQSRAAPNLKAGLTGHFGNVFPGAMDLSDNPEVMLLARYPFPKGVRFLRTKMQYKQEYTDPGTGVSGYLYYIEQGDYKRFYLVQKLAGPTPNNPRPIKLIAYRADGAYHAIFDAEIVAKP